MLCDDRSVDLEPLSADGTRKTKKTPVLGCLFVFFKSARRDSNPRPRPWQGRAPPTEPLAHTVLHFCIRLFKVYRKHEWLSRVLFKFFNNDLYFRIFSMASISSAVKLVWPTMAAFSVICFALEAPISTEVTSPSLRIQDNAI